MCLYLCGSLCPSACLTDACVPPMLHQSMNDCPNCPSPAPSLGRRQLQRLGRSSAAPAASRANFREGKALRSWPASLRVPSGRQRSPAICIGFIPFPSTGPTHPTERKSQLHSLYPLRPYVMMNTRAHITAQTHKGDSRSEVHTPSLSSRHTPPAARKFQRPLSVPAGAAQGSKYGALCDRQTGP